MPGDYLRTCSPEPVFFFLMKLSALSLVRHSSYQLKHTGAATFVITPVIPISPIVETWHLVRRQKIVFKTPQRKTLVPDRGVRTGGKKDPIYASDKESGANVNTPQKPLDVKMCFFIIESENQDSGFCVWMPCFHCCNGLVRSCYRAWSPKRWLTRRLNELNLSFWVHREGGGISRWISTYFHLPLTAFSNL